MQTGKKGLALLLALLMVFSLLPVSALAADGCLTTASAGKAFETKQGELLQIGLAQYFTDSDGHTLTYSLDAGDYGTQTKIAKDKDGNDVLSFTNPTMGEYTPTVTAKCSGGETASVKLSITVAKGEAGDERQYGYDETPADSVTVYVTISSDGMPIQGSDGTILSHLKVEVPYYDLENQGLSDFNRYHTENGSGSYVDQEIVRRPTALHLYLYMIGVYYLGYTPEQITTGEVQVFGHDGGAGVLWMNGGTAYDDSMLALNITGSATSLYMQQFWGHDENLMYFRNHVYPLMGPGWGSTCDYILLSDNDMIDVAMFSNWEFWTKGAFAAFDADDYSVAPGGTLNFSTVKYDTKSVADGGTEEFDPIIGMNVAVYDENWNLLEENLETASGDTDSNEYAYTFEKVGTYYLLAMDAKAGTSDSCYAPATAKVTVGSTVKPFDPAEHYKDFDFSCISLDAEGTDYIYNIEESSMEVSHYANPGEKKIYTVTVPEGTETVYVTYPADFETNIAEYCALFDADGNVSWEYSAGTDYEYSVTENDDGSHTIALPAAFLMEKELYIAAEDKDNSYDYFNCFYFVEGDNTAPGGAVAVTGVKLDKTELTVDRGSSATLTASVLPENADNTRVNWRSANSGIAAVKNGVVTGVSAGTTTVTATTADGGFTAECTVTVTDKNKPPVAEDGYYEIANGAQLKWFANEVNASDDNASFNARLTADIDLTSVCSSANPWTPIGSVALNRKYSGTFDGQGHKITGLYLKGDASNYTSGYTYYTGLFGECDGVTLKNLSVYGTAEAITRYVGGLAGRTCGVSTHRSSLVENCHNYVVLTGSPTNNQIYGHGGLVGTARDTTFRNCSNRADVTGYEGYTGGLVGTASDGVVLENCWNEGHVHLRGYYSGFEGVGGLVGYARDTVKITNCYNTGAVDFYYRTQANKQYAGGLVGVFGSGVSSHSLTLTGCYSTGKISGDDASKAVMGALLGGTKGSVSNVVTVAASDCYYLEGTAEVSGLESGAAAFTAEEGLDAEKLGEAYTDSCPYPVFAGQTVTDHADADADGLCDSCGKRLAAVAVPTRKEGYPAETSATVQTNMAYLLSDLQANKVFAPVDGQTLSYKNYYYQRSTDGGETWSAMTGFSEAIFGMTTIQITETTAGTYVYRFYASHDGEHFSQDTWTLTLTVEDAPKLNFSFYVGKDYTGDYPVIKLYDVTTDDEGNEVLGGEIENAFLYSDFTDALPEGEEEYDPAQGKLVSSYQMFYASLTAGRYAYRAFAKNADTGEYDVALGGMTLNLPTDDNVDGGAGGGTSIYLQCNSFYVSTKKTDGAYFSADEYHVRVDCPIMGTSTEMGEPYNKGNYAYYPTMLYAAGNACLYNAYAYPDIDGYIFTQSINQTFRASYSAGTKSLTLNTAITLTVTVPEDATFGLYFQWNNFNTTEVAPDGDAEQTNEERWTYNGDGTKTALYEISKGNGNYTWRLSDEAHVTQAGWLASQSKSAEMTFAFGESAATNRISHDFSQLGTATATRDEADLQVNLDPTGFEAVTGTTRVRAYRHWQLINSDAGNIMVEPDFHWNLETGDAEIATVNGGNTTANWADVTPGTQDSIITVYYDSIDVNPGNYGTHGGLYPATQPQRVGVIVVGGTGVTHGTADADVDFNMESGKTTTRSMDWDYNYDTWFYEANETDPALTFAVNATGDATVEYAFVAADNAMNRTVTGFTAADKGEDGRYTVPLKALADLGNGKGGTVIIKMTDETGVSYRLVRVAQVTITAENVSHPKEDIMPGDQVKLTFSGMFRAVNKVSGIFNPTLFQPTYYAGEAKYSGTLGQYQKMDNASVTVTVPEDVEFEDGQDTAAYTFTNGYTYGNMYSAANPFAFLYNMTDTGVGTNFNAVMVNYYMNHYADAVVTVHRKVTYDTELVITDESGSALTDVTVTLTGSDGKAVEAGENGRYTLGYGDYAYVLIKNGYVVTRGTFSLGSADAEKVSEEGVLTVAADAMKAADANGWDGTTKTEPAKDENGVYQIGTASELAWFAANGGTASAALTADIELAGHDWTPMSKFYGAFDGQGHTIRNLYVNSASYPLGLFGYMQSGSSVTKLGITGDVTCSNTSNAQAGGIAGYMNDNTSISQSWSSVNVTTKKHGGGIAGYTNTTNVLITDCYATGEIRTTSANECYLGGICSSFYNRFAGAKLTNCYSTATVVGTGKGASYVGGLSPVSNETYYTNSYYLEGSVSGESPNAGIGITGLGTAKTADELKALASTLGENFAEDTDGINGGYPILAWQSNDPAKDAEGYYLLSTAEDMQWFAEKVNGGTTDVKAKLVNDIDLSAIAWTPVGTKDVPFSGVFDGGGHTVNLVIKKSSSDSYQALFGYMKGENAEIRNLAVTGSVKSVGTRAGSGAQYNAGILGYAESGTVKNCYNAADISGRQNIGGVVGGGDTAAVIDNCYNSGSVTATGNFAGGITSCYVTWGQGPALSNCCNSGTVTAKLTNGGTRRIGGIACIQAPNKSYGENLYYLDTCLGGETGEGTAESKTLPELIKLVEAKTEHPFTEPMLTALKALLGDVNGDGTVDVTDAELVYSYSIGAGELTEAQVLLADMDGDGYITAKDAAMIYAIIAAAAAAVTE